MDSLAKQKYLKDKVKDNKEEYLKKRKLHDLETVSWGEKAQDMTDDFIEWWYNRINGRQIKAQEHVLILVRMQEKIDNI